MSGSKDTNGKFDKRAAALRANLMRRKQAKRADKVAKNEDEKNILNTQNEGNEE